MPLRTVLCVLLFASACSLAAQTSVNLTASVADDRMHTYRLDVDQGAAPTAVDVTFTLTTTGSAGLYATLYDVDQWSTGTGSFWIDDFVVGAGMVTETLSLPARAGVHVVFLTVETDDEGPDSSYTGDVTVSAGTITNGGLQNLAYVFSGGRSTFGRVVEFYRPFNGNGTQRFDFDLDFGPTGHTTTFAIDADGIGVTQVRLLNITATPAVELLFDAASGGFATLGQSFTTPSYTGVQKFRIEFTKDGGSGEGAALLVFSDDVTLGAISAPSSLTAKPKSKNDPSCSANANGSTGLFALAALAGPALLWRRRRMVRSR
jgi:hypothetical protein